MLRADTGRDAVEWFESEDGFGSSRRSERDSATMAELDREIAILDALLADYHDDPADHLQPGIPQAGS